MLSPAGSRGFLRKVGGLRVFLGTRTSRMLGFITPPCGLYEPSCVLVLQTQRAARGTARFVLMAPVDRKQRDYLSLLELVPAVVLAALGLSRALRFQRWTAVLQFAWMRRLFVLLEASSFIFQDRAKASTLVQVWQTLNSPSGEVFTSPVTGFPVADTGLNLGALPGTWTVAGALTRVEATLRADPARLLDEFSLSPGAPLYADLTHWLTTLRGVTPRKQGWVARYQTSWVAVCFLETPLHGYVKTRRARSLNKRRAKRLVRVAGHRFWVI